MELIHRWLKVPYILHVRQNRRRKNAKVTVLFLHGLGDTAETWQPIIEQLPDEYRVITIDLLGFGQSPKPSWARLDVKTQARSIGATLLRLRALGRVVVVGHSMGGLIAVEVARRHPRLVRGLVLCSPPFYKPPRARLRLLSREEQLRRLYGRISNNPLRFLKIASLAIRLKLVNSSHEINEENIASYVNALQASIIEQNSLDHAKQLRQPVRVLHGIFDPVVVRANLREMVKEHSRASLKHILAGHEIKGGYMQAITTAIEEVVEEVYPRKSR